MKVYEIHLKNQFSRILSCFLPRSSPLRLSRLPLRFPRPLSFRTRTCSLSLFSLFSLSSSHALAPPPLSLTLTSLPLTLPLALSLPPNLPRIHPESEPSNLPRPPLQGLLCTFGGVVLQTLCIPGRWRSLTLRSGGRDGWADGRKPHRAFVCF